MRRPKSTISTTTKRAIELTRRQQRLTPAVEPERSGSGLLFCQCDGTPGTPGTQHKRGGVACKWDENVSILSVGPAKAQVTRPSDALFG